MLEAGFFQTMYSMTAVAAVNPYLGCVRFWDHDDDYDDDDMTFGRRSSRTGVRGHLTM